MRKIYYGKRLVVVKNHYIFRFYGDMMTNHGRADWLRAL